LEPAVRIEVARPEDVDNLLRIEEECSAHPWTRDHMVRAVGDPTGGANVLVLREGGGLGITGFCAIQVVLDELHVHNLAVRPAARRQGHARRLLVTGFEEGVRRGARRAFLEVRAGNHAALALYRSCGLIPVGLRRAYYREPEEDAVLLERPELSVPTDPLRSR